MTTIVFFIVKKTIENVNNQGKVYFTLKIQDYEELKEESKKEEKKEIEEKSNNESESDLGKNVIYVEKKNDYEVDNIFKLTKMIDEKFSIDYQKVISDFISKYVVEGDETRYNRLVKLKDKIEEKNIYEMLTSNEENEQLKKYFEKIDKEIVDEFLTYNGLFNIVEFLNYIDAEISKVDPTIYVLVGNKSLNFDFMDDRIKTSYNEEIYRGVRIIYHNKMYDYSLG